MKLTRTCPALGLPSEFASGIKKLGVLEGCCHWIPFMYFLDTFSLFLFLVLAFNILRPGRNSFFLSLHTIPRIPKDTPISSLTSQEVYEPRAFQRNCISA
jgi:hypothetical protein